MPGSSVDARAWASYNSAKRDVEGDGDHAEDHDRGG